MIRPLNLMTLMTLPRKVRAVTVLLGGMMVIGSPILPIVFGGEAIIFSTTKPRQDDAQKSQGDSRGQGAAKPREKLPSSNPFTDPLSSQQLPNLFAPKSRKQETREAIQRQEKKNWMLVDQGQLQEKEDEKTSFGIRSYDAEDLEKRDDKGDLFFKKETDDEPRSARMNHLPSHLSTLRVQLPGQGSKAAQAPARRSDDSEESSSKAKREDFGLSGSKELELKSLLQPDGAGKSSSYSSGSEGAPMLFGEKLTPSFRRSRESELKNESLGGSGAAAPSWDSPSSRSATAPAFGAPSGSGNALDFSRGPGGPTRSGTIDFPGGAGVSGGASRSPAGTVPSFGSPGRSSGYSSGSPFDPGVTAPAPATSSGLLGSPTLDLSRRNGIH